MEIRVISSHIVEKNPEKKNVKFKNTVNSTKRENDTNVEFQLDAVSDLSIMNRLTWIKSADQYKLLKKYCPQNNR